MRLQTFTAGLLVGVLGMAALAAAYALDHFVFGKAAAFIAARPEAFRLSVNLTALATLALTWWMGVFFAWIFERAFPAPVRQPTQAGRGRLSGGRAALTFGAVCWLAFPAPLQALWLLWSPLPPALALTNAAAWLVQFLAGSLLLARLVKPAASSS